MTWFKPFMGMFLFISAIFLIQKLTIWLPKFLEHEAPMEWAVSLFLSLVPVESTLIIPIAYFFAVIKQVKELQTNSEIDAMYAGGQSILNIFAPMLWVAVALSAVMLWLTMVASPAGKVNTHNTAQKLATLKAEPTFQPKRFVDGSAENIVFYFEGHNPDGSYAQIMLSDSRKVSKGTSVYLAERATINRTNTGLLITLFDGNVMSGEKETLRSTYFSNYQVEIPLKAQNNFYRQLTQEHSPLYMSGKVLFDSLLQEKVPMRNIAEWNYRSVSSLTVLLLFLFAVPISMQAKRSKHNGTYLIAIGIMLFIDQSQYFLFKKVEYGLLPWWSFWMLFVALAAVASWMFYTVNQRGSIQFNFGPKRKKK